MKKRIAALILFIFTLAALAAATVRTTLPPYFLAAGDTLLPFNADNVAYLSGGEYFVPYEIFGALDVWSVSAEELEQVRLWTSASKYVDCFTATGVTTDQNGAVLNWPSARRINSRFFVPLRHVCDYFGLSYDVLEVSRDVIPDERMRLIRIRPQEGFRGLNNQTFMGYHRNAMRESYDAYYAPQSPPPSAPPASSESPSPTYEDVTVYHSFYDISAGGTDIIFDILSNDTSSDYRFCFYVSAKDIRENAALIRRIAASGHAIGIWLVGGQYAEYLSTSALLFETAKIKTVLVSGAAASETRFDPPAGEAALWEFSGSLAYDGTLTVDEVTALLPTESGARMNLISPCNEISALMLSGVLSYLREHQYTVRGIYETVTPINNSESIDITGEVDYE